MDNFDDNQGNREEEFFDLTLPSASSQMAAPCDGDVVFADFYATASINYEASAACEYQPLSDGYDEHVNDLQQQWLNPNSVALGIDSEILSQFIARIKHDQVCILYALKMHIICISFVCVFFVQHLIVLSVVCVLTCIFTDQCGGCAVIERNVFFVLAQRTSVQILG